MSAVPEEKTRPDEANGKAEDDTQYSLPDSKTLKDASELMIQDEDGKEVPFKSLYEDQPGKQLIVFIRHFFCGMCEQYVEALSTDLPPSTLSKTTPPTTLTIIGCGQPSPIPDYYARTMSALPADQKFKIYCDPTRQVYNKLSMQASLSQASSNPKYQSKGTVSTVVSSLKNIFVSGATGLKGGPFSQNGGEWLFEDGKLVWCRRMRNAQDHAEIEEVKEVLGIKE